MARNGQGTPYFFCGLHRRLQITRLLGSHPGLKLRGESVQKAEQCLVAVYVNALR